MQIALLLCCAIASGCGFAPSTSYLSSPSLRSGAIKSSVRHGLRANTWCMAARKPFIAGNWKMNPETVEEAVQLAKEIVESAKTSSAQVALCVPHTFLYSVKQVVAGSNVELGAQSIYFEKKGAFTGAVSTSMVKSCGAQHVLCGHSERRVIFKNDDSAINKKVRKVLDDGLSPMLCIGELKEEYESKLNKAVCAIQLAKDLHGVSKEEMARVTIAYEPVWAIGTGLTCDPQTAQDVHTFIRGWLKDTYDQSVADTTRILYGGSVTPETVDELMAQPDVDGCLVGGASLSAAKFGPIINFKVK